MKKVLKFNPNDYTEVTMNEVNQTILLQAVSQALMGKNGKGQRMAVPIGFATYGQQLAEKQGAFSDDTLSGPLAGGHEIEIINLLLNKDGTVVATVAQNSWNTNTGVNVNGKPRKNNRQGGYYIVTLPYLLETKAMGEAPSFTPSNKLLNKPPYKGWLIR
jgi:hypothetical protein